MRLDKILIPAMVLVSLGCDGSDWDPSVRCNLFQTEAGGWMTSVMFRNDGLADGYWDGVTVDVEGVVLAPDGAEYEQADGVWIAHVGDLPDQQAGDTVTYELDHPDLGSGSFDLTVSEALPEVDLAPSVEDWVVALLDGTTANDELHVESPPLDHATDLVAGVILWETGDGAFAFPMPVEGGMFEAYTQETPSLSLPQDADAGNWSDFKDALYERRADCANLSLQLDVYWMWNDYVPWTDGIHIELKHTSPSIEREVVMFSGEGGYGLYQCACTCQCDTCEATTEGLEWGTDLTCDAVCPDACEHGLDLCGYYSGSATGECVGPLDAPGDIEECGGGTTGATPGPAATGCAVGPTDRWHGTTVLLLVLATLWLVTRLR